jgi:hypothetical protein
VKFPPRTRTHFSILTGHPVAFKIDAPTGDTYLRTGVYGKLLQKVSMLEIPLNAISAFQRHPLQRRFEKEIWATIKDRK